MKQVIMIIFFAFGMAGITSAGPIAPPLPMTKSHLKIIEEAEKMRKAAGVKAKEKIPDEKEVGIPAYPNSFYFTHAWGTHWSVSLVSDDAPDRVREWYRNQLKGWFYDEKMGLFYQSAGKLSLFEVYSRPSVSVKEFVADEWWRDTYDLPNVKTMITIIYKIE